MKSFLLIFCVALTVNLSFGFAVNNAESKPFIPESNKDGLSHANHLREILTDDSISETCGGVLANPTGGIIFNVLGPIPRNERCVWVIRGGRANSFSLDVLYTRSDSDAQILATCIRKGRATATHVLLDGPGPVADISSCNVVVITYSTGEEVPSSATGFVLQYATVQRGSVSTLSVDQFISPNQQSVFRYPESSTYQNNELSTFTFVSRNADETYNPLTTTNITYVRNQLESGCYDFLNVHYFDSAIRNYLPSVKICDTVDFQLIASQDVIIITFDTDTSARYRGFSFIHSAGSGCGI